MSIAVPIILAVALATSLYGQAGTSWPNFEAEQKKSDKGGDDSSKDKSDKGDKKEKGKSAQKETSGKSVKRPTPATSGGARNALPKRQE